MNTFYLYTILLREIKFIANKIYLLYCADILNNFKMSR